VGGCEQTTPGKCRHARAVAASVRMHTPCFTKLCMKLNGGACSHSALRWGSGCRPSTHRTASRPRVAGLTRTWPALTSRCGPCQQHATAPQVSGGDVTRDLRHPTSYILHPSPCNLHPATNTLHPAPYTLRPAPCTRHHLRSRRWRSARRRRWRRRTRRRRRRSTCRAMRTQSSGRRTRLRTRPSKWYAAAPPLVPCGVHRCVSRVRESTLASRVGGVQRSVSRVRVECLVSEIVFPGKEAQAIGIPGGGCKVHGAGCWLQVAGCRLQGEGCRM